MNEEKFLINFLSYEMKTSKQIINMKEEKKLSSVVGEKIKIESKKPSH